MELQNVIDLLIRHEAIIVHCAGMAKGVGNTETNSLAYLERLQQARRNNFELSCSTVVPGDIYSHFGRSNYFGQVGLILCPKFSSSITFASPTDAGSYPDPNRYGRRVHACPPATLNAIEVAIVERPVDRYNELGLYEYSAVGVFVDPPIQYTDAKGNLNDVEVGAVANAFSDLPLFLLRGGRLYRKGSSSAVPIRDVYS